MSGSKTSDLIGRSPDRRKLIAVVYADMVGYSRLIGLDDAGTLERLRTLRRKLIDPAIEEHGGDIVQTGGDSLLIVFDSIDGAVRCAVKVQQQVPILDGEQPPDRAIRFRIGVNIGDAIADGTDLHGDAVNVAARIQAECPPGGICVTRAVRDHVQDRLGLAFEELGPVKLKNIARPVEAFVLGQRGAVATTNATDRPHLGGSSDALPLPGKPSIAVLAFTNMSGDVMQEYFSDGIADDIIIELSRDHTLFVIARNSSFTYKARSVDVRQVGRELGVRYVVEGSMRREAGRVRVNAQLIDATTGDHVWAERYDRALDQVFAVQDEIDDAVATAIRPAVGDAEQRRVLRKPINSLSAWETYQRGLWHLSKYTRTENERAKLLFDRAADIDPGFVSAHVGLVRTYRNDAISYGTPSFAEAAKLIEVEARKAAEIDPNDSEAQNALALAFFVAGNFDAALDCADHALALNHNSATAHGQRGAILTSLGRCGEGRDELFISLRLNPRDPVSPVVAGGITRSYYCERNYAASVEAARRCLTSYPVYAAPRRWLVAALGQLGRREEAVAALRKWEEVTPCVLDVVIRNRLPYIRSEDHEHMLDGLRKAGWQG
jgi:adenylate cyclase